VPIGRIRWVKEGSPREFYCRPMFVPRMATKRRRLSSSNGQRVSSWAAKTVEGSPAEARAPAQPEGDPSTSLGMTKSARLRLDSRLFVEARTNRAAHLARML